MTFRITEGLEIWFAEEKTSFGWEMVYGTYSGTEEGAKENLERYKRVFRYEVAQQNLEASQSTLFRGERCDRMFATRRNVWSAAERLDKLKLRGEG